MSDSEGLDSVLSYVRGGPYPVQDVMPAQARALLFGQIVSLLISITYKTSLMVSLPASGKNVVPRSFFH